MKPKECVNRNCKNIFYVPSYLLHLYIECEECQEKRELKINNPKNQNHV